MHNNGISCVSGDWKLVVLTRVFVNNLPSANFVFRKKSRRRDEVNENEWSFVDVGIFARV